MATDGAKIWLLGITGAQIAAGAFNEVAANYWPAEFTMVYRHMHSLVTFPVFRSGR